MHIYYLILHVHLVQLVSIGTEQNIYSKSANCLVIDFLTENVKFSVLYIFCNDLKKEYMRKKKREKN